MERDTIDWNDVAVFVCVVECAGFSKAARALGRPKSSVSREVARLERALGVQLLKRTTRSFSLTDAGRAYHVRAAGSLAAMREVNAALAADQHAPRGVIRVTAPPDVGSEVLPELVASFARRYPELRVEVELSTQMVNLIEGGFDVAIRGGRQRDASLVMRRIEDVGFRLYASPAYLARVGRPRRAEELARHPFVLFRTRDGKNRLKLESKRRAVEVTVRGNVASDDLAFVRRAVIAGAGIGLLPEVPGAREVLDGTLESVLPEYRAPGNPLYFMYPGTSHLPHKVALFRDHVLAEFPRR